MHFDDRLATVLRLNGATPAIARIQYRQLVDLLGTAPDSGESPTLDTAFERLVQLGAVVPAQVRAGILGEACMRLRNPRLVALLTQGEPAVAQAAVASADLSVEQWLDLAPALPLHARGAMRVRRDLGPVVEAQMARLGIGERSLPDATSAAEEATDTEAEFAEIAAPLAATTEGPAEAEATVKPAPEPAQEAITDIRELVLRIEAFRRERKPGVTPRAAGDSPRLPLGDGQEEPGRSAVCDFTTDPDGRVTWAAAPFAPLAVGLRLLAPHGDSLVTAEPLLELCFRRRLPLRGEAISILGGPAIAGAWLLDAVPRFDPAGGRFTGYAGRLRRPASVPTPAQAAASRAVTEGEQIRQLLHELRTPVNAIQGFAEVIQQQLFGPTPHEYRALAATVASDAARMLAGFEELERLARIETGVLAPEPGEADLGAILSATIHRLEPFTASRASGFRTMPANLQSLAVALDTAELERLVWRLLAALAGAAAPSEVLDLQISSRDGQALITLQLPASLAATEGEDLFRASTVASSQALSAGSFGTGFALRLTRAEARAAGGRLERTDGTLALALPLLTEAPDRPSKSAGGAA